MQQICLGSRHVIVSQLAVSAANALLSLAGLPQLQKHHGIGGAGGQHEAEQVIYNRMPEF